VDPGPAIREPELRSAIAAVLDEREVLAARDEARGDLERRDEDLVPRSLVVERERGALISNRDKAAIEPMPRSRCLAGGGRARSAVGPVGRKKRVLAEEMLDVGEKKLLMLLLVVLSELERGRHLGELR
jgi:hypothetical protein